MLRLAPLAFVFCAACAHRDALQPPAWHTSAVIDRDAGGTLRLSPREGERFGHCDQLQMSFSDVRSDIPELSKSFAMTNRFAFGTLTEVAHVRANDIEVKSWSGPALMKFHVEGLDEPIDGTMDLDFGFPPAMLHYSPQGVRLGKAPPTEVVDERRERNQWQVAIDSALYSIEFPKGALRAGDEWDTKRTVVKYSWDRLLRDELVADQTWTFLGVEHATDGDYFHFSIEGELHQETKSDVIEAGFRAETRGVARIAARDGEQARYWYTVDGRLDARFAQPEKEDAEMDAKIDATAETTTALVGRKDFSHAASHPVHPGLAPCLERAPVTQPDSDALRSAAVDRVRSDLDALAGLD
ncbi:MAG: hypothetical protein HOW73_41965 [Polyangiaceae bacterium]|nr:hypothetical protein [Polyangiaceae bacterium]